MRAIGIGITDALDDGEIAVVVQIDFSGAEIGMQADVVVDLENCVGGMGDAGAGAVIDVVGVGDDGAESVVAAGELDDDQDFAVLAGGLLRRAWNRVDRPGP